MIQNGDDDDIGFNGMIQFDHGCSVENLDLERSLEEIRRLWKNIRKVQTIPMLLPDWKCCEQIIFQNEEKSDIAKDKDDGDLVMEDGSDNNLEASYPGIMIDLYHNIRIKGNPTAVIIESRTNK